MRGDPQNGFSRNMRWISLRIPASILRHAGFPRDFHRQNSLKPCRCQPTTVSGCTISRAERHPAQIRDSSAQKIRSRLRRRGVFDFCYRIASCCRSARFSAASSVRSRRTVLLVSVESSLAYKPEFVGPNWYQLDVLDARATKKGQA